MFRKTKIYNEQHAAHKQVCKGEILTISAYGHERYKKANQTGLPSS